jgi:hypothetical protein
MSLDRDSVGATVTEIQSRFARFAADYAHLPLYSAVCRHTAEDAEVAELLVAARPGQARPVLFLAAVHDLVLRRPELPAARWYASVVGRDAVPPGDPWPDIRSTVLDCADDLRATIATRTTQTNEVNRAVYLAPLLTEAVVDDPDRPVVLVELGASAGLLLGVDRYSVTLTPSPRTGGVPVALGDPRSIVRCAGENRSQRPVATRLPRVAGRFGVDLHPVDLDDADAVRWLEACLWPDVPGRTDRFLAAVALLREDPPQVRAGDLVDDLPAVIDSVLAEHPQAHLVVFTSWALTYVARRRRPEVVSTLGAAATSGRPVTWLTAEPPGCVPGVIAPHTDATVLGAHRWRQGRAPSVAVWGTCHPHGEWVALDADTEPTTRV